MTLRKPASLIAMLLVACAVSLAADMPKLTIESPSEGAAVQPTPGLGEVVMIKFKTDGFKIISLKDGMKHSDMNASGDMRHPDMGSGMPQSDHMDGMKHGKMAKGGHVHVFLDDSSWYWVHSSDDPVVLVGVPPGNHKVKLELVGADHMSTGVSQTVNFVVPEK